MRLLIMICIMGVSGLAQAESYGGTYTLQRNDRARAISHIEQGRIVTGVVGKPFDVGAYGQDGVIPPVTIEADSHTGYPLHMGGAGFATQGDCRSYENYLNGCTRTTHQPSIAVAEDCTTTILIREQLVLNPGPPKYWRLHIVSLVPREGKPDGCTPYIETLTAALAHHTAPWYWQALYDSGGLLRPGESLTPAALHRTTYMSISDAYGMTRTGP